MPRGKWHKGGGTGRAKVGSSSPLSLDVDDVGPGELVESVTQSDMLVRSQEREDARLSFGRVHYEPAGGIWKTRLCLSLASGVTVNHRTGKSEPRRDEASTIHSTIAAHRRAPRSSKDIFAC